MKTHVVYLREGFSMDELQSGKFSKGHPVACVAVMNNGAESAYQVSATNPKDQFSKAIARAIATGRLKKHPIPIKLDAEAKFEATVKTVIDAMIENNDTPIRARMAARAYRARMGVTMSAAHPS